jgi:hypothetical protein
MPRACRNTTCQFDTLYSDYTCFDLIQLNGQNCAVTTGDLPGLLKPRSNAGRARGQRSLLPWTLTHCFAVVAWFAVATNGQALAQYSEDETQGDTSQEEASEEVQTEATETMDPGPPPDLDPMGFVGIGIKVGYLKFGTANFDGANVTYESPVGDAQVVENAGVPARDGMTLSLPINLGGGGFGWIFEPYLGFGDIGSYGIFTGPLGYFHVSTNTYLGIGFGVRVGIITTNFDDAKTETGYDIYGRIPLDVVYYPTEDLGILLEFGIGYGVTVYEPSYSEQVVGSGVKAPKLDLQIGDTYQLDFSIGVRLP